MLRISPIRITLGNMTRELLTLGFSGLVANLIAYLLLGRFGILDSEWNAMQWLLQSTLLWIFICQQTWQYRNLNRPTLDSPLTSSLGWANRLTILRGWLIAATGGFLFLSSPPADVAWTAAALYSIAAILDRIDGYVARRTRQTSLLGTELDMRFDALGLLVAPLLAFELGKIHWSYLLVSVAYYLFQAGLYWRQRCQLPVYPMTPNFLRRTLAGFQMGLIAFVLWPPFQAQVTVIASIAFMIPVLTGFAVDWLVVSGRISPSEPTTAKLFERGESFSHEVLQPTFRIVLLFTALMFTTLLFTDLLWADPLSVRNEISQIPVLIGVSISICVAMIACGFAARIGALVMILLMAWQFQIDPASTSLSALFTVHVFCTVWIMLMGSGRFSLWQWDDSWVQRYDGAE